MLDYLGNLDALTKTIGAITVFVGAILGLWRWARPKARAIASDIRAGRDALVGRDAVVDSITGRELAPALPGMGVRMDNNERQLGELTSAVTLLAKSSLRLDDHEARLKSLEDAHVERVATKIESAQAWRAVEAVAKAHPEETLPSIGEN